MEIKTCEQYVLNRVKELEDDVERLKVELLKKDKELKEVQDIVTTYDELFREHGTKDVFDSSVHASVDVCEAYTKEKDYYDFIISRNGQYISVHDYRKSVDEKSEEET